MCGGCENCVCGAQAQKWKRSLLGALIAFIVFNPLMYRCVNMCLPFVTANKSGCPNAVGFFIQLVLFMLIIRSIM